MHTRHKSCTYVTRMRTAKETHVQGKNDVLELTVAATTERLGCPHMAKETCYSAASKKPIGTCPHTANDTTSYYVTGVRVSPPPRICFLQSLWPAATQRAFERAPQKAKSPPKNPPGSKSNYFRKSPTTSERSLQTPYCRHNIPMVRYEKWQKSPTAAYQPLSFQQRPCLLVPRACVPAPPLPCCVSIYVHM